MDMFNLAQLTKHLVVRGVRDGGKEPFSAAAEAVRETLKTYLKGMVPGNPEIQQGVKEVARGVMTGLLLVDAAMPKAAVTVLQAVVDVAADQSHDPTELVESSLKGIAELRLLVSVDALALMGAAMEKEFMGTGDAFRKCLESKGMPDWQRAVV